MSYFEHDDAIRSMLRRARLLKADDSGSQQLVDLMALAGDKPRKVFRPQPFGYTSTPPVDSEGVVLALGGRSDRLVYFDGGHKDYRPTSRPGGSTAIYDAYGQIVSLVEKQVRIVGTDTVTIKAPTIVLEGNVKLGGADADRPVSAIGTVTSDGASDVSNPLTKVWGL